MKKNYIALLTVPVMPKTTKQRDLLVNWLRKTAKEIKKEKDAKIYAIPCRFRLMK